MSRQFRSDDTSIWQEKYGTGVDGSITISSNSTFSTINGIFDKTGTNTGTTNITTFSDNDFVLIHQTRGAGAGNWELNVIQSGGGTTSLTFKYDIVFNYTSPGGNSAQILKLSQYSGITINSGATLYSPAFNGDTGGIVAYLCSGDTNINGTISASGRGSRGSGTTQTGAFAGEGNIVERNSTLKTNPDGTSGGGNDDDSSQVGGGGGGHATSGSNDTLGRSIGGEVAGNSELTTMIFGGAGGSWYENDSSRGQEDGGGAGYGGGIVFIISKNITISGNINANGTSPSVSGFGGGGGGAGGSILLKGENINLGSNKVDAIGASGGGGTSISGGSGGLGRIHVDYASQISGTTTPTLSSRFDTSIKAFAGFINFVFI